MNRKEAIVVGAVLLSTFIGGAFAAQTPGIQQVFVTNFPSNQQVIVSNLAKNQNVTVTNPPCEGLYYSVSGQLVYVQNGWNKPIGITSSTTDAGDASSIHSITLEPGQSSLAYNLTVTPTSGPEALALAGYAFPSSTNATLYIRNTSGGSISSPAHTNNYTITTKVVANNTFYTCGHLIHVFFPATVGSQTTFVAYRVSNTNGNTWSNANWNGPSSTPTQLFAANILIGSSCPTCTLGGTPFIFQSGNSYTIAVVTGRNNQFVFTIVA